MGLTFANDRDLDEEPKFNEVAMVAASEERIKLDQKLIQAFKKLQGLRKFAQDTQLCPVAPGLFIGSIGAAQNLKGLQAAGITHILNASPLVPCFYKEKFKYMVIEVHDDASENIAQYFPFTNNFIEQGLQEGGVLVHCYAGVSRSAAFTLAYITAKKKNEGSFEWRYCADLGLEVTDALSYLRCTRPIAQPNSGFMKQLSAFQNSQRKYLKGHGITPQDEVMAWGEGGSFDDMDIVTLVSQ